MKQKLRVNGRYLSKEWEDPYCEEALRSGVRMNRDDKPVQNQSAKRFAAAEVLADEKRLQLDQVYM